MRSEVSGEISEADADREPANECVARAERIEAPQCGSKGIYRAHSFANRLVMTPGASGGRS